MQDVISLVKGLPPQKRKALASLLRQKGINLFDVVPIAHWPATDRASLSYAQRRQWFLWQLEPESTAYNIPVVLRLRGQVDLAALQRSFDALAARHETLRTIFVDDGSEATQDIRDAAPLEIGLMDLTECGSALEALLADEIERPFDLRSGPLLRVTLVRESPESHVLVLVMHHIVSDGWSMQVMVEELVGLYGGFCRGVTVELPAMPIQYADYASWQRSWMDAGERDRQLSYWKQQLGGEQPVLELPLDRARPAVQSYRGAELALPLSAALSRGLQQLAQREGASVFMVLLASFQALLHRYTGQPDVRVGVPIANRNRVETERLIGFFVNTQVLKAEVDGRASFQSLLQQVKRAVLDAQAHQDLPFEQLVEALQPERSLSRAPLFQVLVNHQFEEKTRGALTLPGLRVEGVAWQTRTAQFDLTLDLYESHDATHASFTYATDVFDAATIQRLAEHWHNLLQGIVAQPAKRIGDLPLQGSDELRQQLVAWNESRAQYGVHRCIHARIEEQAASRPEATAVVFGDTHLTYGALNAQANQLAHTLIGLGVGAEVRVGLAVARSLDMVVGVLAILKAGGAYVPLDLEYPQERIAHMLADSGVSLLLTRRELTTTRIPSGLHVLCLDEVSSYTLDSSNPAPRATPDNLAYVIYTSGSTGTPKGALLTHRNVMRLFEATQTSFGFDATDVWTVFHSYAFDFSVWEIFGGLLYGGRLVIVPWETSRSPEDFHALLRREGVTVLNQTPSAFRQLIPVVSESEHALSLRYVIFGGEALDVKSLRPWMERFGDAAPQLINMYGITETTVHVTYRRLTVADLSAECSSPIGSPVADLSWFLLDSELCPIPKGGIGELYVGGAGLARGYQNRGGLSATRFVPNPFSAEGERLYRTGDLARYRSDGVIEYVGRIDHQVKIRGFRIELGEVEARLQELEGVRDAVVLDHDGLTGKQLVGYVVLAETAASPAVLRDQLRSLLPDYMVPAQILALEALPLTTNGKLDRKALPKPDANTLRKTHVEPQTKLERHLAAIWAQVLKLDRVGLHDNFFELGGHSLLAAQVISRVKHQLGLEVALRSLFEAGDLRVFARTVQQSDRSREPSFTRVDRSAPLPLSYAQQRQWFLWQLEPQSAAYHLPVALRIEGRLDDAALQRALDALIARHETLRTTISQAGGLATQVIHPTVRVAIHTAELDLESLDEAARLAQLRSRVEEEIARPFDLHSGPLLRVKLLRESSDAHVLVIVMHHIVSDEWSMQVMTEELVALYRGFSSGEPVELADMAIQYADYAAWQRTWMEAGERERQLAYWVQQLGGEQPVLELPLDRVRPAEQSHRGARLNVTLGRELSHGLSQLAQREGATVFMLLLASFQALLHRYSGQTDIRVGVPVANRNRVETERLIGFFVNTQVLKAEVDSQIQFDALLRQVKQTVLEAQSHQDLPFEQLVEALQPERSLSHNPLFQVMVNHQSDTRAAELALPNLRVGTLAWEVRTAQFDLILDTQESLDEIDASLTYATDLFDAATIERLAEHWLNLLNGIAVNPAARVGELTLLNPAEVRQQLVEWNAEVVEYPVDRWVHARIEAQAERRPDATALMLGDQQLSYRELNDLANRLAHRLIALGVGPEVRVGVATERSLETIVGFLATLKAGGAYVPLDPEYPADRLRYMFEDSGLGLLLTQSFLQPKLPIPQDMAVLCLDHTECYSAATANPHVPLQADSLAYVIYTSGSTGQPKGVAVTHGPLAMHVEALADCYETSEMDCELQFMSFAFDGAHEHWLKAMTRGARMVLRGPELWTPEETHAAMYRYGTTVTVLPPVYLLQLAQHAERVGNAPAMRIYCFGGDAVPDVSFELAKRTLKPEFIINGYGPTETVITPLLWKAGRELRCGAAYAPIGTRVGERYAYLLDGNLALRPRGLPGELYLGGYGVARGYHDKPGLTAERFVPDPFSENGERMYRSGDLTRLRVDGVVDYLGRVDYQVKIRGFRIELGEIEARLQQCDGVRDAVVVAHDGPSGKQLVGYVVPEKADLDQVTFRDRLKSRLRGVLPDYMVPAHLLVLDALPLTPNGKLDRKALPLPDASALQQVYAEPQTELQKRIAEIWADVLKLERVGLTDNFFELGGDSIASIQVVGRARQAGIRFSPKDLFQHQTVQGLASVAELGRDAIVIDQGPVRGELPLLPIQRWFFQQAIPERHYWNQSVMLKALQPLQREHLETAIRALIEHHDALRLGFSEAAGGAAFHRSIEESSDAAPLWNVQIADHSELERIGSEAQQSLDLARGPLLRAVHATLADGSERLVVAIHHLVVDGVSWRVLLEDLQTAYVQLQSGRAIQLPAKTSAYKTWAEKLQGYASSPGVRAELDHWKSLLEHEAEALPCDHPAGGSQNRHAQTVYTQLSSDCTRQLLQEAPPAYRTQINDLLLTALARAVARWLGRGSVLVQLEGHGREELFDDVDLSRTVGWFTTTYPVRLTACAAIGDSIKTVKEQLRAVPHKGIGFGVLSRFGDEATQQTLASLPAPKITFNYLGQFDNTFDAEEGLFVPSGESAGPEHSLDAPLGNELSIDGQVYGGELSLGWTFSGERFDTSTVQRLADDYRRELEELVAHCCAGVEGGVTPSDFELVKVTQAQLDALPLPAKQLEDMYPLSPMQQGMLFHTLYDRDAGDYVNQLRVDIAGLDAARFRSAWQAEMDAHDILRTSFLWSGELSEPVQVVHRHTEVSFTLHDWRGRSDLLAELGSLADVERRAGFDLTRAPLLRLVVVRTAEDQHHLIYTNHHILMDGWSNSQLLGEVLSRYSGQPLAASSGRYRDYIGWLSRQDAAASERFWKAELVELEEPTRLAAAIGGSRSEDTGQLEYSQVLDAAQTQRLGAYARAQKLTVNTIVQAAWLLLLQRYTGKGAVAFGATVSGRPAEVRGVEQQLGLFINTLPVVANPRPEQRVAEWLQILQAKNVRLREHEHTPLYDVQRWAGWGGDALFDTLLVFENYPVSEALEAGPSELRFQQVVNREQTNYPLTVSVGLGEELSLQYGYAAASFDTGAIARLAEHWLNLLQAMIADPSQRIGELRLLSEKELREQSSFGPQQDYALSAGYAALFERQVDAGPERVAASSLDETWTYRELDVRANRVGRALVAAGVSFDQPVALLSERDLPLLSMMIGSFKAGAGYLGLDPHLPDGRLEEVLQSAGPRVLLTDRAHAARAAELAARLSDLQLVVWEEVQSDQHSSERLGLYAGGHSLAYVIYTSGSTGKPKGVLVEQSGMLNNQLSKLPYLQLTERDVIAQTASQSFDISVWQFLTAGLCGARVDIVPNAIAHDPAALLEHVRSRGITVLESVPSLIQGLLEVEDVALESLRWLLPTGEALPSEVARRWLTRYPRVALVNAYGPAECSDDVALYRVTEASADGAWLPIGSATDNNQLYLLSSDLQPIPFGSVGELYVSGTGVGRGYLNDRIRTADVFLPNPFCEAGSRLYRTGDLARYRSDGVLEFIGRVDHQVKIRGFRIELGEIEARLQECEGVRDAVVVAHEGATGKQLVGYLVPTEQGIDAAALRTHLKSVLPDYMVPAHLLELERLPLTPNGKLDRKALPPPDASTLQRSYVEPRTALERQIAGLWADVLKLDRVGLHDHFFELGGHSLLAMQVVSRIKQRIGLAVELRSLFEAPNLLDFVEVIQQSRRSEEQALVTADRTAPLPLSYAQQRQWFLWQLEPQSAAYHIPVALRLEGVLDTGALQRALDALVARHETLRTTIVQAGDRAIQRIHPTGSVKLDIVQLNSEAPDHSARVQAWVEKEISREFDLTAGPLLRVKLLRESPEVHVLVLVMHHVASDDWSMQVMVEDLVALYGGYCRGEPVELPALPIQYADYASWQRSWMDAGERDRQLAYWKKQLGGEQPILELPLDRARPAVQSQRGAQVYLPLGTALSTSLQQLAQREGVTVFMLLLASFQALLHRYTGQNDVRVGVPVANRNRVETERLIGFFVNTQVLKAEVDAQATFRDLLRQVKRTTLDAQAHQDLPFEELVEALQPARSLSHSPLFQVLVNHQFEDRARREFTLPGLRFESVAWETRTAQFDLTLDLFEAVDGTDVAFTYATDLFDRSTIERLADHWCQLLRGIVADPSQRVGELPLLRAAELQQQLLDWNATRADYPEHSCIHAMIEAQVVERPDAMAVVFGSDALTYRELNERANRLAHTLIARGVGPEVLVGIAVERSLEMVVGLLAILKAGGAYVPIDPEYPAERIAYMLEDSGVRLLLTQSRSPAAPGIQTLCLDRADSYASDVSNPAVRMHPENLAYVIYTSGSTGRPKGAGNRHVALTNRLWWMQQAYGLGPADAVLQKTPFSFDVSVWEFFWPLMTGARLVVAEPGAHRDPSKLIETIRAHAVTTLHFVPSMLQAFLLDEGVPLCTSIRRIVCSGEALPMEAQQRVFAQLPRAGLYNLYGPTEAAIDVTHWRCEDEGRQNVPIGRPIDNLRVHVLGAALDAGPIGTAGELLIGGVGLARGYHDRAGLTAERFIPDPFNDQGGRLYRTGDLTRYRSDGAVEYVGRIDQQVKIRGFRIELGEIESCLQEQPEVREAVVVAQDGPSGKQLVGYVVPRQANAGASALRDSLKLRLKTVLPDHMVPAHLVVIPQLPVTPNGKLDRTALPKPDASAQRKTYVEPQTDLQKQIAAVWADVLKLERVSLDDNFFELGGNSLLALQLVSQIRAQLGVECSLHDFLVSPSVAEMEKSLLEKTSHARTLLVRLNRSTTGLTPLFCIHPGGGSAYCYTALALKLQTSRPVFGIMSRMLLDPSWTDASFDDMVRTYCALIIDAHPNGPYLLLGWSLGGTLALSIGAELERRGKVVAFLGIADGFDLPDSRLTESAEVPAAALDEKEQAFDLEFAALKVVAPGLDWQTIERRSVEISADDDQRAYIEEVVRRVAAERNIDVESLSEILSGADAANELAHGDELLAHADELQKQFVLEPLNVAPTCWWSVAARSSRAIEQLSEQLRTQCTAGLSDSIELHVGHEQIAYDAEFIESAAAKLSADREALFTSRTT